MVLHSDCTSQLLLLLLLLLTASCRVWGQGTAWSTVLLLLPWVALAGRACRRHCCCACLHSSLLLLLPQQSSFCSGLALLTCPPKPPQSRVRQLLT